MRAIFVLLAFFLIISPAMASDWPVVRNFRRTFDIAWDSPRIDIDVPLVDLNNVVAYRLICHGGTDDASLDALSEKSGINYVGPLMCVLNEGNNETETSLLAEENLPPWHTRGQFSRKQLVGSCGNYPQHGKKRSFRLRGFVLSFDLSNTDDNGIRATRSLMKISIKRDPRILSVSAQPSGYAAPRANSDCSHVVREPPFINAYYRYRPGLLE